ncbi:MAG: DeoR/GlpR family DNA-binding transcription regulator [Eubacteriaceae bacterium]
MGKKNERLKRILENLKTNNGASVKTLSQTFGVSEMTIRRDLETLKSSQLVTLFHGAAIYNPDSDSEYYDLTKKKIHMEREKDSIGKVAAQLIEPGDTIILDVGTTTEKVAKYIPFEAPISTICFTVNTLNEILKKNVQRLLFGGGNYHSNTQMFESSESLEMIKKVRASKFFVSAAGVSKDLGITCANMYEVDTKLKCLSSALTKILVVDSTKLGQVKAAYFTNLEAIDVVVTDSGISNEWIEIIKGLNITLHIAKTT